MKDLATVYKDRITLEFADEFELALLNAALSNLAKADLLLRVNNFAYALCELIRHVLQNSSPDEKVSACDWFKADPTSSSGITQTHRVKYALQGELSDIYVTNQLGFEEIDEEIKGLLESIDHINGYRRIENNRIFLSDAEVETLAIECLEATLGIVEKISETRHQVQKLVAGQME
ncbi:MAG: hypothetical protein V4732_08160 [Pseudomonadota bacterium]